MRYFLDVLHLNKQRQISICAIEKMFLNQYVYYVEATELACARIEVLRNHGYEAEAVRLALSVARTIKEDSKKWLKPGRCQHGRNVLDINCFVFVTIFS